MTEECLDEVKERTSSTVTVSFIDENGDPVTPDSGTYRLDRPKQKISVLAPTALPSLGTSVDIEITSAQNRVYRQRDASEIAELTVEFDYGIGKHGTANYRYRIINLYGVVPVASSSVSPSSSASPST